MEKKVEDVLAQLQTLRESCTCPISKDVMKDPVVTVDGHVYERAEIVKWFRNHDTSPLTNEPISKEILPVHALRTMCQLLQEKKEQVTLVNWNGTATTLQLPHYADIVIFLIRHLEEQLNESNYTLLKMDLGNVTERAPLATHYRFWRLDDNMVIFETHEANRVAIHLSNEEMWEMPAERVFARVQSQVLCCCSEARFEWHGIRRLNEKEPIGTQQVHTGVTVQVLPVGNVQVFLLTLTGRTLTVNCSLQDPIELFKLRVRCVEGIPCDQQRILFGGRQLEDGRRLMDYNVREDSTLHFVLRIRGGCVAERDDPATFERGPEEQKGSAAALIANLGANPDPDYEFLERLTLDSASRQKLSRLLDKTDESELCSTVPVPWQTLTETLSKNHLERIMMHMPFDCVFLRRARGGSVRFHVDTKSRNTLIVPLNWSFVGGQRAFATKTGVVLVPSKSASRHRQDTAHGVCTLGSGVRDTIHFCDTLGLFDAVRLELFDNNSTAILEKTRLIFGDLRHAKRYVTFMQQVRATAPSQIDICEALVQYPRVLAKWRQKRSVVVG